MDGGLINKKVCKYCAYAFQREENDKKLFPWCSLRCTYNDPEADVKQRRVPYRYKHDTCEHFLEAEVPQL